MRAYTRLSTIAMLVLLAFSATILSPMASFASKKGRQNTAVALTGAAILAAATHHNTAAIGLGAGAAYAWKRHADARKTEAYKRRHHKRHHRVHHIVKKQYTTNR